MLWFILLLVVIILYSSGEFNGLNGQLHTNKKDNALDVLDERYALGELSSDEYDTMKKNLSS